MTEPTRYDAVDDQLVECVRGAAVKYKDWKATDDALRARLERLQMAPDDWLLVTVGEEYATETALSMASALQRGTGRQVLVVSVAAEVQPLSPTLSEAELQVLREHHPGISGLSLQAMFERVMRMRMGTP